MGAPFSQMNSVMASEMRAAGTGVREWRVYMLYANNFGSFLFRLARKFSYYSSPSFGRTITGQNVVLRIIWWRLLIYIGTWWYRLEMD